MRKLLLSIIGLVALCASVKAQVPTYASQTLGTFTCAAATATNLWLASSNGWTVDCRKQANVAVSFTGTNTLDNVGSAVVNLIYQRSVDGSNYETNNGVWGVTMQGKNSCTVITNLPSQSAGYIRFLYATNAAGASTNLGIATLSYGVKISAP